MPENNTSYRHLGPYVGVNSYTTYNFTTSSESNPSFLSQTTLTTPYLTSSTTTSESIRGTSSRGFFSIALSSSEYGGLLNYYLMSSHIGWKTSVRNSSYWIETNRMLYPRLSAINMRTTTKLEQMTAGKHQYPPNWYSTSRTVTRVIMDASAQAQSGATIYNSWTTARINNVNNWESKSMSIIDTAATSTALIFDFDAQFNSLITATNLEWFRTGLTTSLSSSISVASTYESYSYSSQSTTVTHTLPYSPATVNYTIKVTNTSMTNDQIVGNLKDVKKMAITSKIISAVSKSQKVYVYYSSKNVYNSTSSTYVAKANTYHMLLAYDTLDREVATGTYPYVSTTTAYGGYIETTKHASNNDPCLVNNIYCPNELNEVKRIDAVYVGDNEDKAELVYKKEKFLLGLYKRSAADHDLTTLASSLDGITWHDLPNYALLADELLRAGRPSNYRSLSYDNNPNLGMFIFYINGYYYSIYAEPEALSSTANLNYATLHIDKIDPDWNHDSVPEKIIYRVRYLGDFDSIHNSRFRNAQFNVELFKNDDFNYTLKVYGRIASDYTEIFINNVDVHFNENCVIDSIQSSSDVDFNNDFVLPEGEYKENYYLTSLSDDALVRVVHINDQNNNNFRREIYWKHKSDSEWTLMEDLTCIARDATLPNGWYSKNTVIGPSFIYSSAGLSTEEPAYAYINYCLQSSNEYMHNFKFLRIYKDDKNALAVLYYDSSLGKVNHVLLTEDSVPGLSSALGNTNSVYALCALDNLSVQNGALVGPILVWTGSDSFVINGSNIYYITLSGSGWGARSIILTDDYILCGTNNYSQGLTYFNRSDSYSEMVGTLVPDYGKFLFIAQPKPWIN